MTAETARLFISVAISPTSKMTDILDEMRCIKNVRVPPTEQIHITLRFLGDTDVKMIPMLCERLKAAFSSFEAFDVVMKGMGTFPNERNPRIVWIGFENGDALCSAADTVTDVLRSMKLDFDGKKFSPHVTVGRIDGRADVKEMLDRNRDTVFCRFRCDRIDVMKSVLSSKGAKHSVLSSIELFRD